MRAVAVRDVIADLPPITNGSAAEAMQYSGVPDSIFLQSYARAQLLLCGALLALQCLSLSCERDNDVNNNVTFAAFSFTDGCPVACVHHMQCSNTILQQPSMVKLMYFDNQKPGLHPITIVAYQGSDV